MTTQAEHQAKQRIQPLDALTIRHLAREMDVKLADGKINRIQQSHYHDLLIHCWVGGQAKHQKLYLNIKPDHPFCALVSQAPLKASRKQPHNFCLLLRKHLTSGRIESVSALPFERVINLRIQNFNAIGEPVTYILSLELMGKQSNLILIDAESQTILGCAHGVSSAMSRIREVSVGYPYTPPPRPDKPLLTDMSQDTFCQLVEEARAQGSQPEDRLTQQYQGFGKAILAQLFTVSTTAQEAFDRLFDLLEGRGLTPMVSLDHQQFALFDMRAHSDTLWHPCDSVNEMVANYFVHHVQVRSIALHHHQLKQVIKAQIERYTANLSTMSAKEQEEDLEALKHAGDCLTMALSQNTLPDVFEANTITVTDCRTQAPVTIAVDPSLTLSENAQQYYKRYKKAQRRSEKTMTLTAEVQDQLQYAQELLTALNTATTEADLALIEADCQAVGWLKADDSKKKQGDTPQPMTCVSSDGFVMWVGKSQLQNEYLLGKVARSHDLWLHAHNLPGSHVVVKTNKQDVPDQTLLEAAQLAAWYSQARGSANIPVIYTPIKHVRKIPNSYPGHVTYTHESSVFITPEPDRIEALMVSSKTQEASDAEDDD